MMSAVHLCSSKNSKRSFMSLCTSWEMNPGSSSPSQLLSPTVTAVSIGRTACNNLCIAMFCLCVSK